jgi:aldehyde dehydrogenase (NAD+)
LMETWHPIGPCAVITAFNFPMAVFAWNATLALVAGDPVIWKPSERTPLCAIALETLLTRAITESGLPSALSAMVLGGKELGVKLAGDPRIRLVSATGSTRMGREVAALVAPSFRRTLLELGGNNAGIVTAHADVDLAVRAITFSAVGTAGQRCTTMRRLFVHASRTAEVMKRLARIYDSLAVGDPREDGVLVGPLVSEEAFHAMQAALEEARALGATVHGGQRLLEARYKDAFYVRPAIVQMPAQRGPMCRETFAPILYVTEFTDLDQAIVLHNATSHGLSSSIFTNDLREAERFLAATGSDCGIANVNIGTSGAEIGGAFGGEKDSGGGREAGSDAWKAYMRRQTCTVNYGRDLPLAQGVKFDV